MINYKTFTVHSWVNLKASTFKLLLKWKSKWGTFTITRVIFYIGYLYIYLGTGFVYFSATAT